MWVVGDQQLYLPPLWPLGNNVSVLQKDYFHGDKNGVFLVYLHESGTFVWRGGFVSFSVQQDRLGWNETSPLSFGLHTLINKGLRILLRRFVG